MTESRTAELVALIERATNQQVRTAFTDLVRFMVCEDAGGDVSSEFAYLYTNNWKKVLYTLSTPLKGEQMTAKQSEFKTLLTHAVFQFDWSPPWVWGEVFMIHVSPLLENESHMRSDLTSRKLLTEIKLTQSVHEAVRVLRAYCEIEHTR